jgi:hypothetical protein
MALPESSTVITLSAPATATKDVTFDISYTITNPAPGAANVLTTVPPSGCPTEADAIPWTTTLTSLTGTKTLTFSTAGRWMLIINSTPGEPAAVRHKAIEQYVNIT